MVERDAQSTVFSPLFLAVLAVLVLVFNLLAFKSAPGLGWGLFFSTVSIGFLELARKFTSPTGGHLRRPIYILAGIAILSSLFLSFRANEAVMGFNLLTTLISLCLMFLLYATPNRQWHLPWFVSTFFHFLAGSLRHFDPYSNSVTTLPAGRRLDPLRLFAIAVLTLGLVGFFTLILANADPLFQKTIADFFNKTPGEFLPRLVLSILIVFLFSFLITLRYHSPFLKPITLPLPKPEMIIPLSALIALFAFFLVIQAKYLFVPEDQFLSLGVTYSEYVRKGFNELMLASAIAGIIIYFTTLTFTHRHPNSLALKLVNSVIVGELFFLLASAYRRNYLYITSYDLSRTRYIGNVFLFWLLGMLALLLAWNLIKRFTEKHAILGASLITLATFLFVNAANMDLTITRYNLAKEGYTDLFYPSVLSADNAAEWPTIIDRAQTTVAELTQKPKLTDSEQMRLANAKLALMALSQKHLYLTTKYGVAWPDLLKKNLKNFNLSEFTALYNIPYDTQALRQVNLLNQIKEYQRTYSVDLIDEERYILQELKYPFVNIELNYNSLEDPLFYPTPTLSPAPTGAGTPTPKPTPNPTPTLSPAPTGAGTQPKGRGRNK